MDPDAKAPRRPSVVGDPEGTRYELLGRLATGGMAELYLARTQGADGRSQVVVLKRILPHLAEDPEFVRMFRDEAYLASTLQHPNIVRVYDIGLHGEDYFFTMEYVHGENLRAILRAAQPRGYPIPLEHVLTIAIGVTSALHYAHEQVDHEGRPLKIVHRDVSPTNVLVSQEGAVKLVDFGIAKAAAGTHITQAGMLKGKASYMSPEQCRAEPVDRRSDVFSMGILLFEMTTLSRLFRGDNELAILHQVLEGNVPPPSTRRPDYPPELERIVLKALSSDPAARYQTALELQADLERFGRSRGLAPGSAGLAAYIRDLFGTKPLPWTTSPATPERRASIAGRRASGGVPSVAPKPGRTRPATGGLGVKPTAPPRGRPPGAPFHSGRGARGSRPAPMRPPGTPEPPQPSGAVANPLPPTHRDGPAAARPHAPAQPPAGTQHGDVAQPGRHLAYAPPIPDLEMPPSGVLHTQVASRSDYAAARTGATAPPSASPRPVQPPGPSPAHGYVPPTPNFDSSVDALRTPSAPGSAPRALGSPAPGRTQSATPAPGVSSLRPSSAPFGPASAELTQAGPSAHAIVERTQYAPVPTTAEGNALARAMEQTQIAPVEAITERIPVVDEDTPTEPTPMIRDEPVALAPGSPDAHGSAGSSTSSAPLAGRAPERPPTVDRTMVAVSQDYAAALRSVSDRPHMPWPPAEIEQPGVTGHTQPVPVSSAPDFEAPTRPPRRSSSTLVWIPVIVLPLLAGLTVALLLAGDGDEGAAAKESAEAAPSEAGPENGGAGEVSVGAAVDEVKAEPSAATSDEEAPAEGLAEVPAAEPDPAENAALEDADAGENAAEPARQGQVPPSPEPTESAEPSEPAEPPAPPPRPKKKEKERKPKSSKRGHDKPSASRRAPTHIPSLGPGHVPP